MRLLYLSHRIPFPPNKGDKIRSYHHLRHLARRHEVHLLSFVDQAGEEAGAAELRRFCADVRLVPLRRAAALARGVWSLACGRSLSEGYFGARAMRAAVAEAVNGQGFDLAWAYSSVMAQYLPMVPARRRVADFADVDSEKWRQFGEQAVTPLALAYRLEAARVRAFETAVGGEVDSVLFVSPGEADLYCSFAAPRAAVRVVPNGVDTAYFAPGADEERRDVVLFTGALDYRPNIEAVQFFARDVLPRMRRQGATAGFVAVGHRPGAALREEAARSGGAFAVAGSVPDIRPYFRQARVYVAPLRLGRGVQNKVLEAMAMRVPVVASPLAVAGLDVVAGRDAIICDRADDFAHAVAALLRDPQRCRELAAAAARLVADRYTWDDNLTALDACLEDGDARCASLASQAEGPATTSRVAG